MSDIRTNFLKEEGGYIGKSKMEDNHYVNSLLKEP